MVDEILTNVIEKREANNF